MGNGESGIGKTPGSSQSSIPNPESLTLPQLLKKRAEMHPNAVALRLKEFGIWQETTWSTYLERVKLFALGVYSLGLRRDDKLAVIADNIPEWCYAELGTQSIGAISVGIYQSSVPSEIEYMLEYCDVRIVVAEDQEQVDKLLEIRERLPKVEYVIYEDPRGMRPYQGDPWFLSFEQVLERGRTVARENPTLFDDLLAQGRPEDVCHFSSTSGTTGKPKAVMLMHRNYIAMAAGLNSIDPLQNGDDYLSFLPLAWIGEQMMTLGMALVTGSVVNFPEEVETAMSDLREIGPRVMFSPPRVWEGIQSDIWVKIQETYPLNRWLYQRLLNWGLEAADYRLKGAKLPAMTRAKAWLAEVLLFRAIKDGRGFLRLRRAYTGGAALGPDVFRFYHALGINLKQIYGQTEIIGIAYVHQDGDVRFDTVGKPIPGTECRIGENGEILSKSAAVCAGYYKRPEDTAKTFVDGWLHSGDAGYLTNDGHLVVIDRVSDVMHTKKGEMFSPQFLENKLKFSPYIKEAVIFGDGQDYLAAFVNIDMSTVGNWAETRGIAYTTYMDLSGKREVGTLILSEVERVNATLPEHQRIKRFVCLYKLLDADDEELTRTGKVRRGFIATRYAQIVEALYSTQQHTRITAEFNYQDGQTVRLETDVTVYEPREKELVV
jgi:long-chain acyl-CoA synthetase